jgi:hypothetical protein
VTSTKKRMILRMAVWAGVVLGAALLVAGAALLLQHGDRLDWAEQQERVRTQSVEQSRKYLGELAKRIVHLPVDATLVGEIESRYFDEQPKGPMHVWAMGTSGEFLFGVPRETFSRLNAIYDREISPRLKEGVFFERQSFLLGHLDEDDEPELLDKLAGEPTEDPALAGKVLSRLARWKDSRDGVFVLSMPLKKADGAALGSLYLRRALPEGEGYERGRRFEDVAAFAAGVAGLSFMFLWVLLPTWVYVDARERGVRRAPLFAFLAALSSLIGLVVYLIARPEDGRVLSCPGCGKELNGGAYCPHCGRDLSASFCSACRYPLKPDWVFCPACRAEIRPGAAEAPSAG